MRAVAPTNPSPDAFSAACARASAAMDCHCERRVRRKVSLVAVLSRCLFAIVLALRGNGALAERANSRHGAPRVLAELIIPTDGSPVVAAVSMDGKPYRLLVDTGADCTGFDKRHRAALGRPTGKADLVTGTGALEVETFRPRVLEIGGMRLRPRDDIICAHIPFSDGSGKPIDGVLAMDVLGRLVVSFDFDVGRLRFYSAADPNFGRPVALFRMRNGPDCHYVRATIEDGSTHDFMIDTGYVAEVSGSLTPKTFDALLRKEQLRMVPPAIGNGSRNLISVDGITDLHLARMGRMSIGGFTSESHVFSRGNSVNTLALGYLSRYQVVFDFPKKIMYLRPGKQFKRPDVYDLSGMTIQADGDAIRADWVGPGSLAAMAGVQSGDAIMTVDGRSVREMSLFAVQRILCHKGPHTLDIEHRGERRRVTLTLSERGDATADGAESRRSP